MPDYPVGASFACDVYVLDLTGSEVTGAVEGDFTVTFERRSTGNYAAASETLTFAEKGGGHYSWSGTLASDSASMTYHLLIEEDASITLSARNKHNHFFTVGTATGYTETDAYCAVTDVEALLQRGGRSTTSVPTTAQVTDFMAFRAAMITAKATPYFAISPTSGSNDIDTSTDAGAALEKMCRSVNAYGAAADAVMASDVKDRGGSIPDDVLAWLEQFNTGLGQIEEWVRSTSFVTRSAQTASADLLADADRITRDTVF